MLSGSEDIGAAAQLDGLIISNRYEIVRCVGVGAMGSVHLARDRLLSGNVVALKVLRKELSCDENTKQRFLQEVKLMHRVNHPNVVRTYDVGVDNDLIYFTMEHVDGGTLEDLIDRKGMDLDLFIDLAIQICLGLAEIHDADIIHRDLKPANVMIQEGHAKIADFGVARSARSDLTQHKEIIGSTPYIAPEIWMGETLTRRADFYSLGAIFYEMLCGALPFSHDVPATIMWMHLKKDPKPPKELRPDLPEWINSLILRMLAKSPENRPSSSEEIVAYIKKRSASSSASTNIQELGDSENKKVYNCRSSGQIISGTSTFVHELFGRCSSNIAEAFVFTSGTRSQKEASASEVALRGFCANVFNGDGSITIDSLRSAVEIANDSVLSTRRVHGSTTGYSASLAAIAFSGSKVLFTFVGSCKAFLLVENDFFRIIDSSPSSSWVLGNSIPGPIDAREFPRKLTDGNRVVICSDSINKVMTAKEICSVAADADLVAGAEKVIGCANSRAPSEAAAVMFVDVFRSYNPIFSHQIPEGQVELCIIEQNKEENDELYETKYKAYLGSDESSKPVYLEFEERERLDDQDSEAAGDPNLSIIFSNLPSTKEVIEQEEEAYKWVKKKKQQKALEIDKIREQEERIIGEATVQKRIFFVLGLMMIFISLLTCIVVYKFYLEPKATPFSVFKRQQQNNIQTVGESSSQPKNKPLTFRAGEASDPFKKLRAVTTMLQQLGASENKDIVPVKSNNQLVKAPADSTNQKKKAATQNRVTIQDPSSRKRGARIDYNFDLGELPPQPNLSAIEEQNEVVRSLVKEWGRLGLNATVVVESEIGSKPVKVATIAKKNEIREQLDKADTQLKVLSSSSKMNARERQNEEQKVFHSYRTAYTALKANLGASLQRQRFWGKAVDALETNNYLSLAEELSLRGWGNKTQEQEFRKVWREYIRLADTWRDNPGIQSGKEVRLRELGKTLKMSLARVVQENMKKENENLILLSFLYLQVKSQKETISDRINLFRTYKELGHSEKISKIKVNLKRKEEYTEQLRRLDEDLSETEQFTYETIRFLNSLLDAETEKEFLRDSKS